MVQIQDVDPEILTLEVKLGVGMAQEVIFEKRRSGYPIILG